MRLRLVRHGHGENPPEAQRVLRERGSHQVVAHGRGVALVEDEINRRQHRREARREIVAARNLERNLRLRERLLRAHDALRDRRFGHQKRARDFVRRESTNEPQRERDARLRREHRMTRGEHETKHVVADVVVDGFVDRVQALLRARALFAPELFVFP